MEVARPSRRSSFPITALLPIRQASDVMTVPPRMVFSLFSRIVTPVSTTSAITSANPMAGAASSVPLECTKEK